MTSQAFAESGIPLFDLSTSGKTWFWLATVFQMILAFVGLSFRDLEYSQKRLVQNIDGLTKSSEFLYCPKIGLVATISVGSAFLLFHS
jgi:hypothetical protein